MQQAASNGDQDLPEAPMKKTKVIWLMEEMLPQLISVYTDSHL